MSAGPAPAYGTWRNLIPAAWEKSSIAMCNVPYTPDELKAICPGRRVASSMKSFAVRHGLSADTTRIVGSAEMSAIGANWSTVNAGGRPKSLSASGMIEMDERASRSV